MLVACLIVTCGLYLMNMYEGEDRGRETGRKEKKGERKEIKGENEETKKIDFFSSKNDLK